MLLLLLSLKSYLTMTTTGKEKESLTLWILAFLVTAFSPFNNATSCSFPVAPGQKLEVTFGTFLEILSKSHWVQSALRKLIFYPMLFLQKSSKCLQLSHGHVCCHGSSPCRLQSPERALLPGPSDVPRYKIHFTT